MKYWRLYDSKTEVEWGVCKAADENEAYLQFKLTLPNEDVYKHEVEEVSEDYYNEWYEDLSNFNEWLKQIYC